MTPAVTPRIEAERVADRNGDFSRLQLFRIAKLRRGQRRVFIDPDKRKIRVGIVPRTRPEKLRPSSTVTSARLRLARHGCW